MSRFLKSFAMVFTVVFMLLAPAVAYGQRGRQLGTIYSQNGSVLYKIYQYDSQQRWADVTGRHMWLVPMGGRMTDSALVVNFIEYTWWGTDPDDASRWTKTWKGEIWITSAQGPNQFTGEIRWTHLYNNNTPMVHPAGPVRIYSR